MGTEAETGSAPPPALAVETARGEPAPAPRLVVEWDLEPPDDETVRFSPRAYRPTYLLPASWSNRVNRTPSSPAEGHTQSTALPLLDTEAKYQISFKSRLGRPLEEVPVTLWGAYTQSSHWQVYNGAISRPFRETNYEPELLATWPMGLSLPLGLETRDGRWTVELRPWWRLPESSANNDNPDIEDHLGRGEILLRRHWDDRQTLTLALRHSLRSGSRSHGSAQADLAFPLSASLARSDLHGFLQVFTGYGESLIDYNVRQTRIGLGMSIAGWR